LRLRCEIDVVDAQLAVLFERRMILVSQVARIKREAGLPVYDAAREYAVVDQGRARVSPEYADGMERLLREIMSFSKEHQRHGNQFSE